MSQYEEAMNLLEEKFGQYKDNFISLATIGREPGDSGKPRPIVRTIDAYYENGIFYGVTYGLSNKILQMEQNNEVSVAAYQEMFTASGTGENLGWVLKPENAEIRSKLRKAFSAWYDMANNEQDENCCIFAVHLSKGTLNINHWEKLYFIDFENKTHMDSPGIN